METGESWRAYAPRASEHTPSWASSSPHGPENATSTEGERRRASTLETLLSPIPAAANRRAEPASAVINALLSPLMTDSEIKSRVSTLRPRDRVLRLERVGNARDLGGLPAKTEDGRPGVVRFGKLIRAAHLNLATEGDFHVVANELQVRTIVDLRAASKLEGPFGEKFVDAPTGSERAASHVRVVIPTLSDKVSSTLARSEMTGAQMLAGAVLKLVVLVLSALRRALKALPFIGTLAHEVRALEHWVEKQLRAVGMRAFAKVGLKKLYLSIMTAAQPELKAALREVADPANMPVLFHCQFGKDRTGLLGALVLHACGVDREVILDDYALSNGYVDTPRGAEEWAAAVALVPPLADFPEAWARSPRVVLEETLAALDAQYGSLDAYMASELGVDEAFKRRLRSVLVEERS